MTTLKMQEFNLRLQVKVRVRLKSQDFPEFYFRGRKVRVQPVNKAGLLEEDNWLLFISEGFAKVEEARDFGILIQDVIAATSAKFRMGIDVGENKASGYTTDFIKKDFLEKNGSELIDDVHGVMIYRPGDKVVSMGSPELTVFQNFADFLEKMKSLENLYFTKSTKLRNAIYLYNKSTYLSDSVSRLVFSVSAVECLAGEAAWSDGQKEIIRDILNHFDDKYLHCSEYEEVRKILIDPRRGSVGRAIGNLLASLGLENCKREWNVLYKARSALFHGRKFPDSRSANEMARDALNLCGKIISAAIDKYAVCGSDQP